MYEHLLCFVDSVGQRRPKAVLRWNQNGTVVTDSGNRPTDPLGFTFDDTGRIYIAEYNVHRVTRWNPSTTNGSLMAGLDNGTNSNALYCPSGILLESDGDMYVTDRRNYCLKFWPSGVSSAITLCF